MIFDPRFAFSIVPELARGALTTLLMTIAGMALALVVGLAFLALTRSRNRAVAWLAVFGVRFIRGTPLLVQLYLLFYVLPFAGLSLDAVATGVIGLGLHYGAYMSEVYRAGFEAVPAAQWEGAAALGLKPWRVLRSVILPQAALRVLPAAGNLAIGMLKETPLLATITLAELFGAAQQIAGETYRYTEPYTLVGLAFLLLSLPAAAGVGWLERRTRVMRA